MGTPLLLYSRTLSTPLDTAGSSRPQQPHALAYEVAMCVQHIYVPATEGCTHSAAKSSSSLLGSSSDASMMTCLATCRNQQNSSNAQRNMLHTCVWNPRNYKPDSSKLVVFVSRTQTRHRATAAAKNSFLESKRGVERCRLYLTWDAAEKEHYYLCRIDTREGYVRTSRKFSIHWLLVT